MLTISSEVVTPQLLAREEKQKEKRSRQDFESSEPSTSKVRMIRWPINIKSWGLIPNGMDLLKEN